MAQDNSARKFTFDVGWVFVSSVFIFVVSFVLNLLIGNYFDTNGFGIYSLVLTIWSIGTLTAGIGIPAAVIKYVAEYQDRENVKNSLVSSAMVGGFAIGCSATVALCAMAPFLETKFDMDGLGRLLQIVSISFPFVVLNDVIISYLNALRMMKHYALFETFRRSIVLIFTMIFILLGYGITSTVIALVLAPISATIILFAYHKSLFTFRMKYFKKYLKALANMGSQLYVGSCIGIINTQAAVIIIGLYLADRDVGVYATALLLFNALMMMPSAIQKITYPAISSYFGKKEFRSIKNMMENTMSITFVLMSTISLLIVFFIDDFIKLVLPGKADFIGAIEPIRLLMVILIIYWTIVPIGAAFISAGRADIALLVSIVQATVNIIMCIILIPLDYTIFDFQIGGIIGATLALGTSLQIGVIFFFVLCKRVMKIKLDVRFLIAGFFLFLGIISLGFVMVYRLGFSGNVAGLILIPIYIASMFLLKIITVDTIKKILSTVTSK